MIQAPSRLPLPISAHHPTTVEIVLPSSHGDVPVTIPYQVAGNPPCIHRLPDLPRSQEVVDVSGQFPAQFINVLDATSTGLEMAGHHV